MKQESATEALATASTAANLRARASALVLSCWPAMSIMRAISSVSRSSALHGLVVHTCTGVHTQC